MDGHGFMWKMGNESRIKVPAFIRILSLRLFPFILVATTLFWSPAVFAAWTKQYCEKMVFEGRVVTADIIGRNSNWDRKGSPPFVYALDPAAIDQVFFDQRGELRSELTNLEVHARSTMASDTDRPGGRSPWEYALAPNANIREQGLKEQFQRVPHHQMDALRDVAESRLDSMPLKERLNDLRLFLNGGYRKYLSKLPAKADFSSLDPERASDSYSEYKMMNESTLLATCVYYAPFRAIKSCQGTLTKITRLMKPVTAHVSAAPYFKEVLSKPEYAEPLRKYALTLLSRYENRDNLKSYGFILDDLEMFFIHSGIEIRRAQDMAWNIMMALTADGQNLFMLHGFVDRQNLLTMTAMEIISSIAAIFDQLALDRGISTFSYPPMLSLPCDSGKSYHFWVPAFLAREMAKEFGPEGSMWGAYLSAVGYQMLSTSGTTAGQRDPSQALSNEWNWHGNEKTRLDLAYASSGAAYGIAAAQKWASAFRGDLNEAISDMESCADRSKPMREWDAMMLMNPNFKSPVKTVKSMYKYVSKWSDRLCPAQAMKAFSPF